MRWVLQATKKTEQERREQMNKQANIILKTFTTKAEKIAVFNSLDWRTKERKKHDTEHERKNYGRAYSNSDLMAFCFGIDWQKSEEIKAFEIEPKATANAIINACQIGRGFCLIVYDMGAGCSCFQFEAVALSNANFYTLRGFDFRGFNHFYFNVFYKKTDITRLRKEAKRAFVFVFENGIARKDYFTKLFITKEEQQKQQEQAHKQQRAEKLRQFKQQRSKANFKQWAEQVNARQRLQTMAEELATIQAEEIAQNKNDLTTLKDIIKRLEDLKEYFEICFFDLNNDRASGQNRINALLNTTTAEAYKNGLKWWQA